jgi:hypothetical protein
MKKKFIFLTLIFTILNFTSSYSQKIQLPDSKEVIVEGEAQIEDGDKIRAKEQAKIQAFRTAIEEVVGVYVLSETRVQNFQLLEDNIYTKATGFLQDFEILDEKVVGDIYKIKMRVVVGLKPLTNALKELGLLKEWRIMVVIPEEHIGRRVPDPAGETEVIKRFLNAGYKVVDQKQVKAIRDTQIAEKAAKGDVDSALQLARKFGADIIITGEAFSEHAATAGGGAYGIDVSLQSCRARVEARAIRADTGEIIAADGVYGTGVDIAENIAGKKALTDAGGKLADFFIEEITKIPASISSSLELVISEVSYSKVDELRIKISKLRGVKKIVLQEYAGKIATFDIELDGKPQDFAALLEKSVKEIEIISVSKSKIEAKFK